MSTIKKMINIEQSTLDMVTLQNNSRGRWNETDTPERLEDMIRHEGGKELHEAINIVSIGGPVTELVSEIGDVLYLYLRRIDKYPETKIPGDVRGHVNHALELCNDLDINPNHAILMKVLRNDLKYPHTAANNGYSYALTVSLSKMIYSGITQGGGDKVFYDVYEQVGEYWTHETPLLDNV